MKIRKTARFQLANLPEGCPQVTFRGTEFGTIVLHDEFRTVEMLAPGNFVAAWKASLEPCEVPSWIRKAAFAAYLKLAN
jgi:hypothetical protein